jgi:GMP synthase-like glutamine amidotransferase
VSTPRLLIVQHEDDCTPAWFGEWFVEAGLAYDVALGHRRQAIPPTLNGYAGLVVLGGEMGANDDAACPWLTPTKALIARSVADGAWFLGICLGHQLAAVELATAADGTVQAARFGARAWGVQFHPEASPEVFDTWARAATSARPDDGPELAAVSAELALAKAELRRDWAVLAHRWAQLVVAPVPVT